MVSGFAGDLFMADPASNDPIDPDAIGGGSEVGLRRARTVLRWVIVAALAVGCGAAKRSQEDSVRRG